MAVDPEKYRTYRAKLEELVDRVPVSDDRRRSIEEEVFDPAFDEVEALIDESREPRLYVFGRSGAGKSSLINALAGRPVAEVGSVEPTTAESELYRIPFPERYANWEVVDSRGLFESLSPAGDRPGDAVETMRRDLETYRPDVLLHVMTPDQVRAGREDFRRLKQLREEIGAAFPPVVYCLNKVDTHLSMGEELPPESPSTAGEIKHNLDFVARVIEQWDGTSLERTPFHGDRPLYGYEFGSEEYVGVVPLYLKEEPYWNVDTLRWLIGDFLPRDARLQFAQAHRQEDLMREMARDVTRQFSGAAGGIGAVPGPVVDVAVLTPLQLGLIWLIAGFSCREPARENVSEYLGAMGASTVGGLAVRKLARSLSQFLPAGGQAISAAAAFGTTWAIGRSAEAYFFDGTTTPPSELRPEGEDVYRELGEGS